MNGNPKAGSGDIPRRPLGKTGDTVSILGVGGHHLGDFATLDEAARLVHEAIDAGITFFDNCWEYWNGRAEAWLGRALKGRRDKVFLMTKVCTHGRGKAIAMRMLDESLRRLQTDRLDLWQAHAMCFDNDPELAYAKGGVLEAFDQAKKQGKVRFVGFTGHKDPLVHLDMIRRGYPFDTVQMPLNCRSTAHFRSFEKQVLPEANKRGIAVLGMKSMGGTAAAVKKRRRHRRGDAPVRDEPAGRGDDQRDGLARRARARTCASPAASSRSTDEGDGRDPARSAPRPPADGRFEPYKLSLQFDNPAGPAQPRVPDRPSRRRK